MVRIRKTVLQGAGTESGFTLLETLIAVAIIAAIAVAFISALTTTSKNTDLYKQNVIATRLAQSQAEALKSAAYDATAPYYENLQPSFPIPPGFSITVSTVVLADDKQEITVAVSNGGRPLFELKIIKTNWA